MDDVGREAGVTRLIVYRIFETKEALYRAVLDEVSADLYASFNEHDARENGVSRLLLDVARRHPDGFRLLWRHANHEPEFAEYARVFRDLVTAYTETLLGEHVGDALTRHWMAQTLVGYHYDGLCTWLDDGDVARDDEYLAMVSAGSRALVSAWLPDALPAGVSPAGSPRSSRPAPGPRGRPSG